MGGSTYFKGLELFNEDQKSKTRTRPHWSRDEVVGSGELKVNLGFFSLCAHVRKKGKTTFKSPLPTQIGLNVTTLEKNSADTFPCHLLN